MTTHQFLSAAKRIRFEQVVHRPIPLLVDDLQIDGVRDQRLAKAVLGYDFSHPNYLYLEGDIRYDQVLLERRQRLAGRLLQRSPALPARLLRRGEAMGIALLVEARHYPRTAVEHLSPSAAQRLLARRFEELLRFTQFLMFPLALGSHLERVINAMLERHGIAPNCASEMTMRLTTPQRKNQQYDEQVSLLRLARRIKRRRPTQAAVAAHLRRFRHSRCSWGYGRDWTAAEVERQVRSMANPDAKLAELRQNAKQQILEQSRLTKELHLKQEELQAINLARDCVWFRTYRADTWNSIYAELRPLIERAGQQLGLKPEQAHFLTRAELLHGNLPTETGLVNRQAGYTYLVLNRRKHLITGAASHRFKQQLDRPITAQLLQGVVANAPVAKVTGVARIVKSLADLPKVRRGDILVAPMTTPSFLSAMRRAAAFVTDEGGILCHAAIVARELGKPCVIGTKVATKVLKDGQVVAINTETGTIE